ncbi:3-deoxy-D-manno-octulosonic acid transferase [Dyadobacter sp. CECT 9623]|uniref:3-deoxy-D-manno-octulosonic acid transferase n=1 Tax=Dyadobacter linearis TaxID=2823330 RepID=A0ABM8URY7_9BACT|nr:glycosyltransferase N-terminal domain-containing protein [Dyadobacter sp. CECT 9623]CAG5070490.1 3-deoxy-D-manno-octulosonic acid transferase [Dyadobacter sp. CECT 9623]
MGTGIYQLAINLFASVVKVAAPFNKKIQLGVDGRRDVFDDLKKALSANAERRPVAWFHAASLGEFEQGRPVMEAYKTAYSDHFLLLTFFSPSGYEVRKNYSGADFVCYLPIDTQANAIRFVKWVKPEIAFFIKYEFWFNYLRALKKNGTYIVSFSSIFRPSQIYFKPHGFLHRQMLACVDHLFVQNQESISMLHQIGIIACSIAGDTRFDRVREIATKARDLPEIAAFKSGKTCLIAGSVWEADMQVLIPVLNQFEKQLKAIIAPHEIKKEEIEIWRKQLKGKSVLYSELHSKTDTNAFDFLIIDNVGMLSSLYKYGEMAWIGGSFGVGLHNILEAATFGLPVIFGDKSYHRFQEAVDLVKLGGAFPVSDSAGAGQLVGQFLENHPEREKAGRISENYVASGTGATDIIMSKVKQIIA